VTCIDRTDMTSLSEAIKELVDHDKLTTCYADMEDVPGSTRSPGMLSAQRTIGVLSTIQQGRIYSSRVFSLFGRAAT
jgi:hypothetical protein